MEHDGGTTNKPAASRRVRVSTGLWLPAMCSAECQGAPVSAWPRLKRRVCVQRCQGGVPGDGGQQGAVVCTCGLCGHARRERSTKCPRGLVLSRTRRHGCVRVQKVVARLGFNVCVPRGQERCSLGVQRRRLRVGNSGATGSCRRRHTKGRGAPWGWLRWSHRRPEATPVARQRREWSGAGPTGWIGEDGGGAASIRGRGEATQSRQSSNGGVDDRGAGLTKLQRASASPSFLPPSSLLPPLLSFFLAAAAGKGKIPPRLGFAAADWGLYRGVLGLRARSGR